MSESGFNKYSDESLLETIFSIENNFNDEQKEEIETNFNRALEFAQEKHDEQFRDSGEPYIEHLKRTLHNVFSLLYTCIPKGYISDLVVASILHDVIEDTDVDVEELSEKFGENVANIVSYISKKPIEDFGGNNEERKKEYHDRLEKLTNFDQDDGRIIILKHIAAIIKAADRIDNLKTMWSWTSEKIRVKIKETVDSIIPIYNITYNKIIIQELRLAVKVAENQIFKNES